MMSSYLFSKKRVNHERLKIIWDSRQQRHGAIWHCSNEIDTQTLIQTSPSLLLGDQSGRLEDPCILWGRLGAAGYG